MTGVVPPAPVPTITPITGYPWSSRRICHLWGQPRFLGFLRTTEGFKCDTKSKTPPNKPVIEKHRQNMYLTLQKHLTLCLKKPAGLIYHNTHRKVEALQICLRVIPRVMLTRSTHPARGSRNGCLRLQRTYLTVIQTCTCRRGFQNHPSFSHASDWRHISGAHCF